MLVILSICIVVLVILFSFFLIVQTKKFNQIKKAIIDNSQKYDKEYTILKNIINDNTSRLEYYDIFADEKSTSTAATDDNTSTIK